jgi:hypothetical protein
MSGQMTRRLQRQATEVHNTPRGEPGPATLPFFKSDASLVLLWSALNKIPVNVSDVVTSISHSAVTSLTSTHVQDVGTSNCQMRVHVFIAVVQKPPAHSQCRSTTRRRILSIEATCCVPRRAEAPSNASLSSRGAPWRSRHRSHSKRGTGCRLSSSSVLKMRSSRSLGSTANPRTGSSERIQFTVRVRHASSKWRSRHRPGSQTRDGCPKTRS